MKNRKIPYGYEMKNGAVVINGAEAETVKNIFSEYVNGLVLKDIAATLKAQGAEYLPGEADWNKSRVKRIIDDARYCGNEKYPEIISAELYSAAGSIKQKGNRAKEYTVCSEDKPVTDSVRCSLCGGRLRHITDNSNKKAERWVCEDCRMTVYKTVSEVKKDITKIINRLIHSPSLTENGEDKGYTESQGVVLKTAEIERMTAAAEVDITAVQKLIFECAEEKYRENETARHITERMKAELINTAPLSEFSDEIFSRTVKATVMEKDGTVRLTLKNGTVLGKGDS